jgi:hypothetical protein
MAQNKFLVTAKGDRWGAVKKGEQFIVESNQSDRPSGLELRKLLLSQGRNITSYSDTLTPQSWEIKKI